MYTLFRVLSLKRVLAEQAPAVGIAWVCAELFYKFHSFTLECAAFLATWFVADLCIQSLKWMFAKRPADQAR
ncbi:MAG TPA: hypothetical protein VGA00_05990 [Acidiferrobacterales bacterium]|jgi:hypothetical protein